MAGIAQTLSSLKAENLAAALEFCHARLPAMNKSRLDLEIARALRNNDDALALELMREKDALRVKPRPIAKAAAAQRAITATRGRIAGQARRQLA